MIRSKKKHKALLAQITVLMCIAFACGTAMPDDKNQTAMQFKTVAVAEQIKAAARQGQWVWIATEKNELLRLDPGKGNTERFATLDNSIELLVTMPNRVLVVTHRDNNFDMQVFDPTTRKVLRVVPLTHGVRGLHAVSDDLVACVDGGSVCFIHLSSGKTLAEVRVDGGVLMQSHLDGDKLYVAREYAGGLAVIDVAKMKLLEIIPTRDWLFQAQAIGDRALVWGSFNGLGLIDLKTKNIKT